MIPNGLFTQIGILILSLGIIFTYVKPTFSEIAQVQNKIESYQIERDKVKEVNDELERQISVLESVSATDHRKILTYMPDEVDPIAVMRDLTFMTDESGVVLVDIADEGIVDKTSEVDSLYYADTFDPYAASPEVTAPTERSFSMSVKGSYSQIKDLLDTMSTNDYLLEVNTLNIVATEGGFLTSEFLISVYSFSARAADSVNNLEAVN